MPRLEARLFMPSYEEDPSHSEAVLAFAKLDFYILQKQHQQEVCEITVYRHWRSYQCLSMLATTSYVGMGDVATEEAFAWVSSDPKILTSSTILCRLTDDFVSDEFEQKRGLVASVIECYVNQYGATEEEAVKELGERITNAWQAV